MRVRLALATVALAGLVAPAPAAAAEPVMALGDVRAGMACEGRSVVRGTAVSTFAVDVIDVIDGDPSLGGPRLLIRVSGPAVDATGVGPGFSGSPVYCRDSAGVPRIAGAISEGIGAYGNDVVLATPIESILGVRQATPPRARTADALVRRARPLMSPLTVSGLSAGLRDALLAGARRAGRPVLAAPAGPAGSYPPYPLVPGSSVAAGYSSGDIAVAAIGTVTYRDGARLWAFGHPLDGAGRRSLPLLDAYVFSVIGNPLGTLAASTYKLAAAGRPVGRLTTDGVSAIAGRVGKPPPTIPLRVSARAMDGPRRSTLRMRVADERRLDLGSGLGLVGTLAAGEASADVLGATPSRVTTSLCLRVAVAQSKRPLGFCGDYFNAFGPLDDLSGALSTIDDYKLGPLGIRRATIRMQVRAGVREAFMLRARAPRRVEPGERIRIRLVLRRSRAGKRRLSFSYRVPRSARPGPRILTLRGSSGGSGGGGLLALLFGQLLEGGADSGPPRSVGELGARVRRLGGRAGIRATLAPKGKGPIVHRSDGLRVRGKVTVPLVVAGAEERPTGVPPALRKLLRRLGRGTG